MCRVPYSFPPSFYQLLSWVDVLAPGPLARQPPVVHVTAEDVHVLSVAARLGEALQVLPEQLPDQTLIHI